MELAAVSGRHVALPQRLPFLDDRAVIPGDRRLHLVGKMTGLIVLNKLPKHKGILQLSQS